MKYPLSSCGSKVICGVFLTVSGLANAIAQQAALQTAEPTRFALIIGNANYENTVGGLPVLGSPCSGDDVNRKTDVKVMADALRQAQWKVDVACNLTTEKLRSAISAFNDKVLYERRAFGIVYFSGHGAQVNGTNYLFGIDANIDNEYEAQKYDQNPYAVLFGGSAISLDESMQKVRPLWGKGVVVIVDACRTNPLIERLIKKNIKTARYPYAASQPTNMVYAFATASGSVAPDGGLGSSSRYSRFLAEAILKSGGNPGQEEIEQVLNAATSKVIKDSHYDQVPGRSGGLQNPPRFCIKGCPSLLSDWESWTNGFTSASPPNSFSTPQQLGTFKVLQASRNSLPIHKVALQVQIDPVSRVEPGTLAIRPEALKMMANLRRKVQVDILHCVGDGQTSERESKSRGIQSYLAGLTGTQSPIGGFEVGEIRLLPLPLKTNQQIYQVNDSVVVYNEGSPAQQEWAKVISAESPYAIRMKARPGTASDYLSIIVCDAANLNEKPSTLYVQVASKAQIATAKDIQAALKGENPATNIPSGIEVVKSSPKQTEVRYFLPSQEAEANRVAKSVSTQIDQPVKARFIPGYEKRLQNSSTIEVWLGKDKMR